MFDHSRQPRSGVGGFLLARRCLQFANRNSSPLFTWSARRTRNREIFAARVVKSGLAGHVHVNLPSTRRRSHNRAFNGDSRCG